MPFRTSRRIEFRDTDAAGIIHFSAFVIYMEEAEHEFVRSLGLSVLTRDELGAISWPRVSVQCEFLSPVRFEDVVDIDVSVIRLGEKSVTYGFEFSHQGRAVARGKMTAVCCRFEPGAAPCAISIPPQTSTALAPHACGDPSTANPSPLTPRP